MMRRAAPSARNSLILLSVVLEQQTELHPAEIMSDTGAYTDTIFGIFHLLGFQFSPRLADVGGARFWRADPKADYGPLDAIAAQRANTALIAEHWEDLLRLAGSLKLGTVQASRPDPDAADQGPPDEAGPRAGGGRAAGEDPLPAPLHR